MKKWLSCVRVFATPWTVQARTLEWVAFPSAGDLPNLGMEPRSPALQVDFLPAEPQRKAKNTGVGSLSHLQQIFPIQESNWGLLHCRWILHCLNHQGSPHTSTNYPTNRSSDHWKDQGPAGGWHQAETDQRLKYQISFSLPYPDAAGVGFISA